MNSRRGFLKSLAAVPAALALVDLRKVVPSAPENAKAYGAMLHGDRRYVYIRAGERLDVGDMVQWSPDGETVIRCRNYALIAGVAMGQVSKGHYGFMQVSGPNEFELRR